MKKLISITLALCLLISAVPFAVSAAESGAPVGDTYVCDDFEYTVDGDDFAKVIKYLGSETDVVVPSRLDGHFVSTIGRGAFAESLTVKSVSFIGGYVFEDYCLGPSVSAVDLPTNSREETLPILDKYEITMPGGKKAVVSMKNLTLYSYPPDEGETTFARRIADDIVSRGGHTALVEYGKNTVDEPDDSGYYDYDGYELLSYTNYESDDQVSNTSLYIPDELGYIEVTELCDDFLYNYDYPNNLTSIRLPSKLKTIGSYALAYNRFTSIELPQTVESIGSNAFEENDLDGITIPYDATIGNDCFESNNSPLYDHRLLRLLRL